MERAGDSGSSANEFAFLSRHDSEGADSILDAGQIERERATLIRQLNSHHSLDDLQKAQEEIDWDDVPAVLVSLAHKVFDTRALEILGNRLLTFRDNRDFIDIFNAVKRYHFFDTQNVERAREELRKRTEGFTI